MIRKADIISRIERHKSKIKELSKKDISDYYIFSTLAMECFQMINSAIELGELVVAEKNLGFPSRYKEIFDILYDNKLIGKKVNDALKRMIFLRNLIAHEYYTIKNEELLEIVELADNIDELIKSAKKI